MISRRAFSLWGLAGCLGIKPSPRPPIHLACSALDPLAAKMRNAGTPIRVFLNGREVEQATAFDSREGWVEFFKFQNNSRKTLYSRIYGTVTTQPPIAELARMVS